MAFGLILPAELHAQDTNQIEQLKRQLEQMQHNFDRMMREQQDQIDALKKQLDATRSAVPPETAQPAQPGGVAPKTPTPQKWSPSDPIRVGRGAMYMDIGLIGTFAAGGSTAEDIAGGTQLGGHDPNQRGFTVQGLEATFSGAVDPYFRGNANVLFQVDAEGESILELEEAWLETVSLPGNLQIRGGQYLSEFGRINIQHPHAWAFVDLPLVNGRFLGPDGLRNPGARLSWLTPTPFYSELFLGVQDSHGETVAPFRSSGHAHGGEEEEEELPFAFRHPDNDRGVHGLEDLLFTPRYAVSFDVADTHTLLLGVSGAFGPNSRGGEDAGETTTAIYGLDFTWKWKPVNANAGYPFVMWQTEAMLRNYDAGMFDWDENGDGGDADGNGFPDEGVVVDATGGAPAVLSGERLTDYGFYTQLVYGFRKGWIAGLRFDYVDGDRGDYERAGLLLADNAGGGTPIGDDPERARRWRISPNLTWHPTEFSKIRLQYNYDDRRDEGVDHSVWLQFEFVLGAHGAHKFDEQPKTKYEL